jgi:hypothetical protein
MKCGSLKLLEPSGPVQACRGIALPFTNDCWSQWPRALRRSSSASRLLRLQVRNPVTTVQEQTLAGRKQPHIITKQAQRVSVQHQTRVTMYYERWTLECRSASWLPQQLGSECTNNAARKNKEGSDRRMCMPRAIRHNFVQSGVFSSWK